MMERFYNLASLLVVDLLFKFEHLSFDLIDANTKKDVQLSHFLFICFSYAQHTSIKEALACFFFERIRKQICDLRSYGFFTTEKHNPKTDLLLLT